MKLPWFVAVAVLLAGCSAAPLRPDAAPDDAGVELCDHLVGWRTPLQPCTPESPCGTVDGGEVEPNPQPRCATPENKLGRPLFDDGPPRQWVHGGLTRYACVYRPPVAAPRPLVLWFHGGSGSASDVYRFTSLRQKAPDFALSSDPSTRGFVLVSVQSRRLHWPTTEAKDGMHHDFLHRDLSAQSRNEDIASVDQLIDDLVAEGVVDPRRIFVSGISNGGFFAQLYAIARFAVPTAGGLRVAAAAVYSAADPFARPSFEHPDSCDVRPYPTSNVPIFIISRACDLITCNQAQQDAFVRQGRPLLVPGGVVESWVQTAAREVRDPNVTWQVLSGNGDVATTCTPAPVCFYATALVNHVNWPDGVMDRGGIDHEPDMLNFLARHAR